MRSSYGAKWGTAPITTEVSAKCCLTSAVSVLMLTADLRALVVAALKLLLNSTATAGSPLITLMTDTHV